MLRMGTWVSNATLALALPLLNIQCVIEDLWVTRPLRRETGVLLGYGPRKNVHHVRQAQTQRAFRPPI